MATLEEMKRKMLEQSKGKFMSVLGEEKDKDWLVSPALDLNRILSGSLYKSSQFGTHTAIVGPEACLDENTIIPFERFSKTTNKRLTHKKQSIKNLYNRFHGIQTSKNEYHKFRNLDDIIYYVKSINEENKIIKNLIVDVVKTGKKDCFKLETVDGFKITTSKDHRFYIGEGKYIPLENLNIGDIVYIHTNKRFKNKNSEYKNDHVYINVKFHPHGKKKNKNGYEYYYIRRGQLVLEANLNKMSTDEYKKFLDTKSKNEILKLNFIDKSKHIHHKNKIDNDDRFENLELIDKKSHLKNHAVENHNNLRFMVYETKIKNISYVGKGETYDIKCLSPYNNYVANNFVTHNSGKSSLMALMLADAQKKGYLPVVVDAEGGWDRPFVSRWGIDPGNLVKIKSLFVDDIMPQLAEFINNGYENLAIAIDSIGGLELKKMVSDGVEGEVKADQGRLQKDIKRLLKMIVSLTKFNDCISFSAGHFYGSPSMYGSPEQLGGGFYYRLSADTIISLKKSLIYENPTAQKKENKGKVLGTKINAATLKNRKYPAFQECVINIDYQKGVEEMAGLLDVGLDIGLIEQSGSWFSMNGERLGQGIKNATENINGHLKDEFLEKLEKYLETTGYSSVNRELEMQEKDKEENEKSAENTNDEPQKEVKETTKTEKKKPGRPKSK